MWFKKMEIYKVILTKKGKKPERSKETMLITESEFEELYSVIRKHNKEQDNW